MSSYQVQPLWREDSIAGQVPGEFYGTRDVDGDASPWEAAPRGVTYWKKVNDHQVEQYLKVKNDERNDDWVLVQGRFAQRIDISEFTDGGSTTGTLVLEAEIPAGAFFQRAYLVNNTAATGVSTLTIQIGDGTDADRYSTGTPSVKDAALMVDLGVPSGTDVHVTAVSTVTVTLTEDDDFTDVTAWATTVVLEYTGVVL